MKNLSKVLCDEPLATVGLANAKFSLFGALIPRVSLGEDRPIELVLWFVYGNMSRALFRIEIAV